LIFFLILPGLLIPGGFLFPQANATDATGAAITTEPGETVSKTTGEEFSEDPASPPLVVQIETSSANPVVNSPWSVYILVNHPNPQEVNVIPPRFPASLALERVRTESRSIRDERWTRVEFRFTPMNVGAVSLGSFEVGVPGRQAVTGATNVRFREEPRTVRRYTPRIRVAVPIASVPSGEQGELILELSDWDPQKKAPEGLFRSNLPRNAILEEAPPTAAGEGVYRYTITIIALDENNVVLEPFSLQAEGFTLSIPLITVPVLPALVVQSPVLAEDEIPGDEISNDGTPDTIPHPFPASSEKVFFLFQGEYSRIIAEVRSLWEEGRRAEAMAEIRRNERDSLSGPFLVSLRREMEQALNLGFTEDERWRPLKLPLLSWVILGLIVLFAGLFLLVFRHRLRAQRNAILSNAVLKKNVTSRRRGGFRNIIILVLLIGLVAVFLEEGLGNFFIRRLTLKGNPAVLEQTPAYRVPDIKGAVNVRFGEGQPVIIGAYRLDWCYAESPDGRAGWVKREAVISY